MNLALPVVLADLDGQVPLTQAMVECADLQLVATLLVALNPLVLVRVVQPLDRGMAFGTQKTVRAEVPSHTSKQGFAVFRVILEKVGRPSEVPHVVCIDASLAVV